MAEGDAAQVAGRRVLPGAGERGHQPHRRAVVPRVPGGGAVGPRGDPAQDGRRPRGAVVPGELPRRLLRRQRRSAPHHAEDGGVIR